MEVKDGEVENSVQNENVEIEQPADAGVSGESAPEYTPSYVYKVLDQEKQFDDRLKEAIKSKEDEDYIRDLYTKADGLEAYKKKYTDIEVEAGTLRNKVQTLGGFMNKVKKWRDEGDYDSLFNALGIEEEARLSHALKLAQLKQMPEDQRNKHYESVKIKSEYEQAQERLAEYESRERDSMINHQVNELNTMINHPEVSSLSGVLKTKGIDLREEVLKHGHYLYQVSGKEPSVKEAVEAVVNKYKAIVQAAPAQPTVPTIEKKQTTPAIKAAGGINRAEKRMTLDELRKMANNI